MKSTSRSPPTPSAGDTPIRMVRGNWGEYLDSTGRKFYFNSLSKEATWKPPRKSLGSSGKLNVRFCLFERYENVQAFCDNPGTTMKMMFSAIQYAFGWS
jgi:hypothetical protein